MIDPVDLAHRFSYHKPGDAVTVQAHVDVRDRCYRLAEALNEIVPDGREKSLAMTKLEEVMFWANAAIARNQGG
jgi:hypothetical protein